MQVSRTAAFGLAERRVFIVTGGPDISPELQEFISQLIVPLLVERLMQQGHLYTAAHSYYDAEAAEEAA